MAAIYGHRWASAYGDAPEDASGKLSVPGDTWSRGLSGVTEQQIGGGLNRCIASADPWPPTLPEFRALCLDIPTLAAVRADYRAGKVSPFMRLLHQHLDVYRMRHAEADRSDRMFRDAYETAREHVMRGGALPPEPVAYIGPADEPEPIKPAAPEVVASVAEKLRSVLGDDA